LQDFKVGKEKGDGDEKSDGHGLDQNWFPVAVSYGNRVSVREENTGEKGREEGAKYGK